LPLRDRLIRDTVDARIAVARLIRLHKPRLVVVGVRYAEAFKSRSPLLVADPEAFAPSRFG
jgi:hypothetical protein